MYLENTDGIVMREDLCLTKISLAASKKDITRTWLNVNTPKWEQWIEIVQDIFVMEKLSPPGSGLMSKGKTRPETSIH